MKRNPTQNRRRPQQDRARQTIKIILDAVAEVLKRDGISAVTTNRIAEVAGVSIGSVYQYFPDKRAIFVALHQRHIEHIDGLIQAKHRSHGLSLEDAKEEIAQAVLAYLRS
jgi:AcrR family transcriptional regulator